MIHSCISSDCGKSFVCLQGTWIGSSYVCVCPQRTKLHPATTGLSKGVSQESFYFCDAICRRKVLKQGKMKNIFLGDSDSDDDDPHPDMNDEEVLELSPTDESGTADKHANDFTVVLS